MKGKNCSYSNSIICLTLEDLTISQWSCS